MADEPEADEVFAPADGPPLSVWLAVLLLVGPPAALIAYEAVNGSWGWLCVVPVIAVTVLPATFLICGDREGVLGGLCFGFLVVALAIAVVVAYLASGGGVSKELLAVLAFGWWGTSIFGLAWWPATRRWCNFWPPPDPDDEG